MKIPVIALVAVFSFVIPAIAGLIRYKRLNTAMKIFSIFCVYSGLLELTELVLAFRHVNNTFLSKYHVVVESVFMCVVYIFAVGVKRIKRIMSLLTLLFLCIWTVDRIYFDIPGRVNSEMAIASRILIILISVLTIHTISRHIDRPFIDEPIFWVSSGTLIYSAGVALIIGFVNDFIKMGLSYYISAWNINWSLEILCNFMFTKGFFCEAKEQMQFVP